MGIFVKLLVLGYRPSFFIFSNVFYIFSLFFLATIDVV